MRREMGASRIVRRLVLSLILLLAVGGAGRADPDAGMEPDCTVHLLDDTVVQVRVAGISEGILHRHGDAPIPLEAVWTMEPVGRAPGKGKALPAIRLRDGSVLHGSLEAWTPEEATLRIRGRTYRIPSSELLVWIHPEAPRTEPGSRATGIPPHAPARGEDLLHAHHEGRDMQVAGLLQAYADGAWTIRHGGEDRTLRAERLRRIDFAQAARPALSPPQAALSLTDASLLHGDLLDLKDGRLRIRSPSLGEMTVPWRDVMTVHFLTDRILFLDTLEPIEVVEETITAPPLPFRRNVSLFGTPMRMHGDTFHRGLAVHAHASLTYALEPGWDAFHATIGLDESAHGTGDCVFRVDRDGETVLRVRMTGSMPPQAIRVPLEGATRLRLVVEYGERFDLGDNANWARARLVR